MNLRANYQYIITMALLAVFTLVYSIFYLSEHRLFNSPDETANYFFLRQFAERSVLTAPLNFFGAGADFITPRSARVIDGNLAPASFWGLIVFYGLFGKVFTGFLFWLILGLVGAFGVWGSYKLFTFIWEEDIAVFSALSFAIFPAWFYYASFGLFPNVLLLTLFIWSLIIWQFYLKSKNIIWLIVSIGLTITSLAVGLAALPWISFVWFMTLLATNKKYLTKKTFYIGGIFLSLGLGGLFLINKIFFGNPLTAGYVVSGTEEKGLLLALFPGGIQPRLAFNIFYQYYLQLFWFVSWPASVGFFMLLARWQKLSIQKKYYLLTTVMVTSWLVIYYGSWQLADNIKADEISLGVAYVRYFLPIYLLSLPLAIYAIRGGIVSLPFKWMRLFGLALVISGYIFLSSQLVLSSKNDSLLPVYRNLQKNIIDKTNVLALTPNDSIIVSYRQDKMFFPERGVIHVLDNQEVFAAVANLAANYKIYWYSFLSNEDFEYFVRRPLASHGYNLRIVATFFTGALWEVIK